jgi:hypothetical protein
MQDYEPFDNPTIRLRDPAPRSDLIFDDSWAKSTFVISEKDLQDGAAGAYERWIRANRYASSADYKFSSTAPGMSLGVNAKPQFTRYCDPRSKGRVSSRPDIIVGDQSHPAGLGMGSYYSEAIDDNQQRIFMRLGIPNYIPLAVWLSKSFDIDKTILQGRGTITTAFLSAVDAVSKFFAFAAAPVLSIAMFLLKAVTANERFYSVRPTMYTYWLTVDNILNQMVARRTMLPTELPSFTYKLQPTVGNPQAINADFIAQLNSYVPDMIHATTGRISVFAIALRAQAAYNRIKRQELEDTVNDTVGGISADKDPGASAFDEERITPNLSRGHASNPELTFPSMLFKKAYDLLISGDPHENVQGLDDKSTTKASTISFNPLYTDENNNPLNVSLNPDDPQESVDAKLQQNARAKSSFFNKYSEYMLAEMTEGSAFAVFDVESTGSVGESFSSSFGANPIESTFNAISAKARNLGSMLESAAGSFPVVDDALKLAADAGAKIVSNATFGLANPLLALAYGVNISMPKIWESSSASLPKASYKLKLISPYGNAYSQLFNIYLPLAMVMAASLPRTTGASSYMSPFFCEVYDRGRSNIQLGMVESVSITRGTSNLAFTRAGHPNAIDVEMSIANLDEIVSVDVSSSGVISRVLDALSDIGPSDTPFVNYLNTITAVDVYTLAFKTP